MNTRIRFASAVTTVVCALTTFTHARPTPLGTAFTYQGQLKLSGNPVNSTADFQFTLFDAPSGGTQVAGPVAANNVTLINGTFAVPIDFGSNVFDGNARWLQIAVRSPAGGGSFQTLTPRQPLTATPYALQTRGIFVDSNNNVGIATTNTTSLLTVGSPSTRGTLNVVGSSTTIPVLSLTDSRTGGHQYSLYAGLNAVGSLDIFDQTVAASRLTITSGGAVGIGTATPAAPLHVRTTGPFMVLQDNASAANQAGYVAYWNNTPTETAWVGFGTPGSPHFSIVNTRAGGNIVLSPGNGSVGIGSTNAFSGFKLIVEGGISSNGLTQVAGLLQVLGNICASGSIGQCSDARFKHNVAPIDGALAKIEKLRGVNFDWKREQYPEQRFSDERQIGLIAQEVEMVVPELVQKSSDGSLAVDYARLTPLLVEAVKEQQKQIEERDQTLMCQQEQIAELRAEKDAQIAVLRDAYVNLRLEKESLRDRLQQLEELVKKLAGRKGDAQ